MIPTSSTDEDGRISGTMRYDESWMSIHSLKGNAFDCQDDRLCSSTTFIEAQSPKGRSLHQILIVGSRTEITISVLDDFLIFCFDLFSP